MEGLMHDTRHSIPLAENIVHATDQAIPSQRFVFVAFMRVYEHVVRIATPGVFWRSRKRYEFCILLQFFAASGQGNAVRCHLRQ